MADDFDFSALAEVLEGIPAAVSGEAPSADAAPPGFGDYVLEAEIARGGMGIVYRARQTTLDRVVAVKFLRDGALASGTEVERFRAEAAAAAGLRHRNIVGIHEIGEHDGHCFFSMEYVSGPTLGGLLKDGPLPVRRAAGYLVKIAAALAHAHGAGVLHRDLKPSNILLDETDEPMVTDFGLAKRGAVGDGLTLSGQVVGTPAYMAPEQAQGLSKEAGPASDVYGLGALLYHLLTGRPPFAGESHLAVLKQVVEDEPVSVALLHRAVPRDLETICAKAMAKESSRRYVSAQAMKEDLQRFLDGRPVLARPVSPVGKLWRWSRRHRGLAAALAGVGFLLAGIAVVSTVSARRLRASRDQERTARSEAETNAWRAELNLYASDMNAAWQNYQGGALDTMVHRLNAHLPAMPGRDPRGFEWHLLDRLSQGDQTASHPIPGRLEDAAFADRGRWLAVAADGQVRLLDTDTREERARWPEPAAAGPTDRRLERQPGGSQLVTSSGAGLRSIDPETGRVRVLVEAGCGEIAFSRDGTLLAVAIQAAADAVGRVHIFRTADWSLVRDLDYDGRGLAWTAEGRLVIVEVTPLVPGRLTWIDLAQSTPVRQFEFGGIRSPVRRALLNILTDRLYLQLANAEGVYARISDGRILVRRPGLRGEQVVMDDASEQLAYAGEDQALRTRNLIDDSGGPSRRGHTGRVLALSYGMEEGVLRSVSVDGTLRFWDLRADWQAQFGRFFGVNPLTGGPVFSPDGTAVICPSGTHVTGQDDLCRIRDLTARRWDRSVYASPLAWHSQGEWLLALRRDVVVLLHLPTDREVPVLKLPDTPAKWLPRVSPDWTTLVWTADGRTLRVTGLSDGRKLGEVSMEETAPAFSPDGTRLALPGKSGLRLLNVAAGIWQETRIPAPGLVAWSPGSRQLAVSDESAVRIHDVTTGALVAELTGHRALISSLAWSPDGRTLVVGCEDRTLHFWHLVTRREALVLPLETVPVFMACAPDGSSLVVGGERGYRVLETAVRLPRPTVVPCALPLPDPASGTPILAPAPPPDPAQDESIIKRRLRTVWEAAQAYRRQHGQWPDHLSRLRDLLPEPMDRALQIPAAERGGGIMTQNDYLDPNFPSSFHYNWSAVLVEPGVEPKDLTWTNGPVTQRDYAEHTRALHGDQVPFIRIYALHEEGKMPAILYDGTLALIPDDWEKAYRTGWRPVPWK